MILQWDPYREVGALWKGTQVLYFRVDSPIALYNYQEPFTANSIVLEKDGTINVDQDTLKDIQKLFDANLSSTLNRTISTIFIDPGHGGKDPGAVGSYQDGATHVSVKEKDVVLKASLQLAQKLKNRYPLKNIILSRKDDRFISLPERAKIANAIEVTPGNTILFISVHVNASLNTKAYGFEVWYLPPEHRRPNLVDAHTVGVNDRHVLSILNTIKEEEFTIESVLLAKAILSGLNEAIGSISRNRGIRQESWYVVRQARMPSVLVELGFISNPAEAKRLNTPSYLSNVVSGIYQGIEKFVADFER